MPIPGEEISDEEGVSLSLNVWAKRHIRLPDRIHIEITGIQNNTVSFNIRAPGLHVRREELPEEFQPAYKERR